MQRRDIVVIGCSAGGVEALPRIVQQLPPEFPAAVFIVQHMAATKTPYLVDILARSATIPVTWAEQGERFAPGHVYVAPPDAHMIFSDDHISLTRGAREKHSRPSIDRLFRSAAATHAGRVIGVLLTGMLDDGVAGLRAIRDAGGRVVVQDPEDAAFPELPARALLAVAPDRVLPIDAIGAALAVLVREPVSPGAPTEALVLEAALDRMVKATPQEMAKLGPQSALSCPDCAGPTWQLGNETERRYRCYLGHVASTREVLARGELAVETALWSAVRALNERAMTLETLSQDCASTGNEQAAKSYQDRAATARKEADLARQFMLDLMQRR